MTDLAGNAVTPYSSTFNTGASPVTAKPVVIAESVASGDTGVPVNASFSVQFNEPMVPSSFTPSTLYIIDTVTGQPYPLPSVSARTGRRPR